MTYIPGAQGVCLPEGKSAVTARSGLGDGRPGGVSDRGTHEEDGPVTWEILFTPRRDERPDGEPLPKSPTGTRKRKPVWPGQEEASAAEVGRKQGEPELSPKVDRKSED